MMAEICTEPKIFTVPDEHGIPGDTIQYEAFGPEHTIADIARWIMKNHADAAELHIILGDMLWTHSETVGLTQH